MSRFLCSLGLLLLASPLGAQTPSKVDDLFRGWLPGEMTRAALGVTSKGTPIPCVIHREDLDFRTSKVRVLIVAGTAGADASVPAAVGLVRWWATAAEARNFREKFVLSLVPGLAIDEWSAGKTGAAFLNAYPPRGDYPDNPERAYLWRWIGIHAPDLVVILTPGNQLAWSIPASSDAKLEALRKAVGSASPGETSLAAQLVRHKPANVGTIAALELTVPAGKAEEWARNFLGELDRVKFAGPSPARKEMQARLARQPLDVARQLARRYGQKMATVNYIEALALIARLELGEMTRDPSHQAAVEKVLKPYVSGQKQAGAERAGAAALAGFLVFGEMARREGGQKYLQLLRSAADRAFDSQGQPLPAIPGHSEMSDAVFMGCPLLAQAGKLTGEKKYFLACDRNLEFMRQKTARKDGLYRHSPLDETAWGRGNGFPALGLALALTDVPDSHPGRTAMLKAFREHLSALLKYQDATGAWHQVIDFPGSYRELTATCMIAFAMARGVRLGWLTEKEFGPAIERAWQAIRTRIADDGSLVDVCTGTGKQKNLRAYLDRKAILGPDDRGGALALLVSLEMARRK